MKKFDDKEYWKRLQELGEKFENNEKERKEWKENVQLFSKFLGDFDRQYLYNETFLPLFTEKFSIFLHYFSRKYPLVMDLMSVCDGRKELELLIDRYWKIEGRNREYRCLIYEKSDYNLVNREEITIEAVLLIETKRFVFHDTMDLTEDEKRNQKELKKLKEKLEKFIEIPMRELNHGESECTG